MQSSILSFATNQSASKVKTHLGSMYCIDTSTIDSNVVAMHEKLLKMQPKTKGPKAAEPFDAFMRTETQLCVPRFYGIANFGNPTTSTVSIGASLGENVDFVQDCKEIVLDLMGSGVTKFKTPTTRKTSTSFMILL